MGIDNQMIWDYIRDVVGGRGEQWKRAQARKGLRWIRDVLWAGAPAAYSQELHRHDEPEVRWPEPQPQGDWLTLQQVLDLVDEPFLRDRRRREVVDRWLDTQFSIPKTSTHITGTPRYPADQEHIRRSLGIQPDGSIRIDSPATRGPEYGVVNLDEIYTAPRGPEYDLFWTDEIQLGFDGDVVVDKTQYNFDTGEPSNG